MEKKTTVLYIYDNINLHTFKHHTTDLNICLDLIMKNFVKKNNQTNKKASTALHHMYIKTYFVLLHGLNEDGTHFTFLIFVTEK